MSPGKPCPGDFCMTYRDPRLWVWTEALELLRGAEKLQRRFYQLGAAEAPCWEPSVDLYEMGDQLTLCVALPGVAADELEASLESGTVVVPGERAFPLAYQAALISPLDIPSLPFERPTPLPPAQPHP